MTEKPPFEIPQPVRDMAEQNLDQAKDAYSQFMEASRKAQDMMAQSSDAVASGAKEVQQTAVKYTEENMKSAFELADKLVRAKDFQEALEIQGSFARQQMEAFSRQAQELTSLMAEAAKKTQS